MDTVAENSSPERNRIRSLQVMRTLMEENKTQNEDTEQNEDSSLRVSIINYNLNYRWIN